LESGDTIPQRIASIIWSAPLRPQAPVWTGARPVLSTRKTLYWIHSSPDVVPPSQDRHVDPKVGGIGGLSNFVREIPKDTAVDEASIEAIVKEAGFNLCYAPEAMVKIKGPETIVDFLSSEEESLQVI